MRNCLALPLPCTVLFQLGSPPFKRSGILATSLVTLLNVVFAKMVRLGVPFWSVAILCVNIVSLVLIFVLFAVFLW